jgi:hypothetical protein
VGRRNRRGLGRPADLLARSSSLLEDRVAKAVAAVLVARPVSGHAVRRLRDPPEPVDVSVAETHLDDHDASSFRRVVAGEHVLANGFEEGACAGRSVRVRDCRLYAAGWSRIGKGANGDLWRVLGVDVLDIPLEEYGTELESRLHAATAAS